MAGRVEASGDGGRQHPAIVNQELFESCMLKTSKSNCLGTDLVETTKH